MTRRRTFSRLVLERLEERNAASDTLAILLAGLQPTANAASPPPTDALGRRTR